MSAFERHFSATKTLKHQVSPRILVEFSDLGFWWHYFSPVHAGSNLQIRHHFILIT
jgi:hypothetical protein